MMSTGATRPTRRLFTKVPRVKPPTESSTIRPNSRGLKPMLSCSTKGTPASIPKFSAKAKPSGRMWPRKRRSRSISPEPRNRLDRSMRSLRNLLVSRRPASVTRNRIAPKPPTNQKVARQLDHSPRNPPIVGASDGAMFWPSEIQLMTSGISLNV